MAAPPVGPGPTCPFCGAAVAGTDVRRCAGCDSPYHATCLDRAGACAVSSCATPAAALPKVPVGAGTVRAERRPVGGDAVDTGPPPPPQGGWSRPLAPETPRATYLQDWASSARLTLGDTPPTARWIAVLVVVVVLAAAVVLARSDDGELSDLAAQTCEQLDGSTLADATAIVERANVRATALGYSDAALLDAVGQQCPETVEQIVDAAQPV